jgi:hypothetical protein
MRNYRTSADGSANWRVRPEGDLQVRRDQRSESERKRSSAESVDRVVTEPRDLVDAMRKRCDARFVAITHNPITMVRMEAG